jgi:hypothetical protein
MKYSELEKIAIALNGLDTVSIGIPFSTGLKILRNRDHIKNTLAPFYELKKNLFNKYADGKTEINPGDKNYDEAFKGISDLSNEEIDFDFEKINESELEKISLPMTVIEAIYPMIDSGGEANG